MANSRGSRALGWVLVIIGVVLILHYWLDFHFDWTALLMILGAFVFVAGVVRHDHGAVFPGTFLFLLGLFFYLKENHFLFFPWWEFWPLLLLALGMAFMVLFLFDPNRKGVLLPGIILIAVAFLFLFSPWSWPDIFVGVFQLWHLWPVALILVGIYLVIKSLRGTG